MYCYLASPSLWNFTSFARCHSLALMSSIRFWISSSSANNVVRSLRCGCWTSSFANCSSFSHQNSGKQLFSKSSFSFIRYTPSLPAKIVRGEQSLQEKFYIRIKAIHQYMRYGQILSQRATCVAKLYTNIWSMDKYWRRGLRA